MADREPIMVEINTELNARWAWSIKLTGVKIKMSASLRALVVRDHDVFNFVYSCLIAFINNRKYLLMNNSMDFYTPIQMHDRINQSITITEHQKNEYTIYQ